MRNFKEKMELRKLKTEVAKLKKSVRIWNNPQKLIEEQKIPSHKFARSGQLYFREDELVNHLKNSLK
ncbi:hypothetical protein ES705_44793 [subsurface metagenome]